jgi:23S rRNA (cytidine1920-2'-O)/16S rRNA (cytidine1409-2'-O)-methyltransferase
LAEGRQPASARKARLDALLVERGLAESRSFAQRLIMAGDVRVDGQVALKPGRETDRQAAIEVDPGPRFVSRGGDKLEAALETFGLSVDGRTCADVGSSTGGFTDCLLKRGASRVYAIDVGHGILHWSLRQDPRIVVLESTNARYLETLPEPVDWVTMDASFISLRLLLPVVVRWLTPGGGVVALIKPQFEAGRESVGRGGVVRDPGIHRRVLEDVLGSLDPIGLAPHGLIRSPLLGPKGNVEFLLWAELGETPSSTDALIEALFPPSG